MFAKVKFWFHAASGKKIVTWIGVVVTTISAICGKLGIEWIHQNVPWLESACTITEYLGIAVTALGRGLADRRVPKRVEELG